MKQVLRIKKAGNTLIPQHSAPSCNHCWKGKSISVTCSECVFVALGIQHLCAYEILLSVACPELQNISTLSHKRNAFEKKTL
jgi:hypothetical protein